MSITMREGEVEIEIILEGFETPCGDYGDEKLIEMARVRLPQHSLYKTIKGMDENDSPYVVDCFQCSKNSYGCSIRFYFIA